MYPSDTFPMSERKSETTVWGLLLRSAFRFVWDIIKVAKLKILPGRGLCPKSNGIFGARSWPCRHVEGHCSRPWCPISVIFCPMATLELPTHSNPCPSSMISVHYCYFRFWLPNTLVYMCPFDTFPMSERKSETTFWG